MSDDDSEMTLDAVLVAFQKSLARTLKAAEAAAEEDERLARGERQLFAIPHLEVDFAFSVLPPRSPEETDRVRVSFAPTQEARSVARFRIEGKHTEAPPRPSLRLMRDGQPGKDGGAGFIVEYCDAQGEGVPNATVQVQAAAPFTQTLLLDRALITDFTGRARIMIAPPADEMGAPATAVDLRAFVPLDDGPPTCRTSWQTFSLA